MFRFKAVIEIIGINPYVSVPDKILKQIFRQAGKEKGHIPIHGTVNRKPYRQTLVKYKGSWRLYINTTMLRHSPKHVGKTIEITVAFDTASRTIRPHPAWTTALTKNKEAKKVFDQLPPSRQKEIVRYISFLKTEESIIKNVKRAIDFLEGKGRFVGRDKPL